MSRGRARARPAVRTPVDTQRPEQSDLQRCSKPGQSRSEAWSAPTFWNHGVSPGGRRAAPRPCTIVEAAGLRRQFSPARPPGLGGGHCALGLVDVVAHESLRWQPSAGVQGLEPRGANGARRESAVPELCFRRRRAVVAARAIQGRPTPSGPLCATWFRLPAMSYSRSLTLAKSRSKVAHEPSDSSPALPNL